MIPFLLKAIKHLREYLDEKKRIYNMQKEEHDEKVRLYKEAKKMAEDERRKEKNKKLKDILLKYKFKTKKILLHLEFIFVYIITQQKQIMQ